MVIELKSRKTRISAPAQPSATDGRVSGLVEMANVWEEEQEEVEEEWTIESG